MANTKSAVKNIRKSKRKKEYNRLWEGLILSEIKSYRKKPEASKLAKLQKALDKAVSRGIYKKNKVNRIKSNLSKKLSALPRAKTDSK